MAFPISAKAPGWYPDVATLAKLGSVYKASNAINSTPVTQNPQTPVACTYGQLITNGGCGMQAFAGTANFIQNLSISSSGAAVARLGFQQNGASFSSLNGTATGADFLFGANGGYIQRDINQWAYEFGNVSLNSYALQTTFPNIAVDINVIKLTADFDWFNPVKILILSDSIPVGSMGNDANGNPYYGDNLWAFRLKRQLAIDGIPCQIVNKGIPGASTNDLINGVRTGVYDCGGVYDWNFIYISFGCNDANGTAGNPFVTVANYTSQLGLACDLLHIKYPKASIVVLGQSDSDIPALRSNSPAFRNAAQGVVSSRYSSTYDIFYYNQAQAYTFGQSTTDPNVASINLPLGTQLHPSGIGHGLLYQNANADTYNGISQGGIYPVTKLTKAYNTNKPN